MNIYLNNERQDYKIGPVKKRFLVEGGGGMERLMGVNVVNVFYMLV
jgi:hypothetical protein